jgi:hypothetical protein
MTTGATKVIGAQARHRTLLGALVLIVVLAATGCAGHPASLGMAGPGPEVFATPSPAAPLGDEPFIQDSPSASPSPSRPSQRATARIPKQAYPPDWQTVQVSSTPSTAKTPTASRSPGAGADITAIGDSIMVDAMPNLRSAFPGMEINAVAGRQVDAGLAVMQDLAIHGQLDPNVVIELGTNGTFTWSQLSEFLSLARGRHIVMLTNHCPYCSWVPTNNELMATSCTPATACSVADWETLANLHPEWFAIDGVHMPIGGVGGEAFTKLIANTLGRPVSGSSSPPAPSRPAVPS